MLLVVVIFFATLFCVSEWLIRDRVAATLARLYLGWWASCLVASVLNPVGIYAVSGFAYSMLLLNVAMFMAGFIATGRDSEAAVERDALCALARSFRRDVVASRATRFVLVGLSIYLARYYVRYLKVLADVGPAEARNIRFSIGTGTIFGNAFEALVFNYFAEALAIGLVVIVSYSLVLGAVRNWVFLWAVADLYLFASIGAGRTVIVQAGVFVVFLVLVRGALEGGAREADGGGLPELSASTARRKNLFISVVLPGLAMVLFMVYLTFARLFSIETSLELLRDGDLLSIAAREFLDQVQAYSIGPFRALDYALSHPSLFGFQFGRLTFGAVDEMIGYPFRMLGFDYPIMNQQIGQITQEPIFIGSSEFNALYTCVFRFYFDFGIPGVVVLSFAFGAVVRGAVRLFNASPSAPTLAILLVLFGVAFLSMQAWHLSSPAALIFLLGAYLLHRGQVSVPVEPALLL